MKCDKCRKEMKGESIMVDFEIYHPTCIRIRPSRGRIADAMKKDFRIPLSLITHLSYKIKLLLNHENSIIRLRWKFCKKHYGRGAV